MTGTFAWTRMVIELEARAVRVTEPAGRPFLSGKNHPKVKLSEAEVLQVFVLHSQGMGSTEISRALGGKVQKSAVSKILRGHRRRQERLAWVFNPSDPA